MPPRCPCNKRNPDSHVHGFGPGTGHGHGQSHVSNDRSHHQGHVHAHGHGHGYSHNRNRYAENKDTTRQTHAHDRESDRLTPPQGRQYRSHSRDAMPFGRFPVLKWDPNDPNIAMAKIYRGGTPIPDRATVSSLDIERVEQLYPIMMQGAWGFDPPEPPLEMGLEGQPRMRSRDNATSNAKQPPYRAVVSDVFTTTIRPAPTDFPADFDDPEANEQFKQSNSQL